MSHILSRLALGLGLGLIVATSGCNSSTSDSSGMHMHDGTTSPQMDGDHSAHGSDMDKMHEALADFSEQDRQSALKQHICPVSGAMLGTMGVPEKVEVAGQSVWICCEGCKEKLLADPDKYLAKLSE
ncbi:MAG: hypothetical protein KDA92_13885 [Planctomycetales bacterium]|nr:hypothetical protein [Planctomycetales bacterium]